MQNVLFHFKMQNQKQIFFLPIEKPTYYSLKATLTIKIRQYRELNDIISSTLTPISLKPKPTGVYYFITQQK